MNVKLIFSVFMAVFFLSCGNFFATDANANANGKNFSNDSSAIKISFDYNRASSIASNQMALWIEDEIGNVVKNLYASAFTAKGRGYRRREDSLNHWVSAAKPDSLSSKDLDAFSGATLRSGKSDFSWDLTDSSGKKVPAGKYFVKLEGTLYWKSNVLFVSEVDISDSGSVQVGQIQETRSEKENHQNENMILNVKIEGNSNGSAKVDNTKNWLGGLSPENALKYMEENYDKGLVIVEVNTDYWKLKNGFKGAMHIPHDQMAERYAEIPSGVPVILHCGAGVVSVPAYETLKEKRPDIPQLAYIAGHPPVSEFNEWLSAYKK